jgi:hypothetical protein
MNSALKFTGSKSNVMPAPVVAQSKSWVCGISLAEIAGSNPSGGMDVCLVNVVFLGGVL